MPILERPLLTLKFNHVVISILMLVLVGLSGLAVDLRRSTERDILSRFSRQQSLVAIDAAHDLQMFLSEEAETLRLLTSLPSFQRADYAQEIADLQSAFGTSNLSVVSLYDAEGALRYISPASPSQPDQADLFLGWARNPQSRGTVLLSQLVKAPAQSTMPLRFWVRLATPIHRHDGDRGLTGVLSIAFDVTDQLVGTPDTKGFRAAGSAVWVMDQDGVLLFHQKHPEMEQRKLPSGPSTCGQCHASFDYARRMLQQRQGAATYAVGKEPEKLAAFSTMKLWNASWLVVLTTPLDEPTAAVKYQQRREGYLAGLAFLAIVASAFVIVRNQRSAVKAEAELTRLRATHVLEEEIRRSEERYRMIVESSHDLIYMFDSRGRLTFVNARVMELSGNDAVADAGNGCSMVHPDDLPRLEQAVQEALATGSTQGNLELKIPSKERQVATVSFDLVPLSHGVEVVGVVGFGTDVTAMKESERQARLLDAQYRQAQKMEIVGHFAGGIAHDFNNLLTAILGYTNLLLEAFDANDPRREDLEEIRKAGERAAALTNQLLVFSRKQVLQLKHLDLNDSIEKLEQMLRRLIREDVTLATVLGQNLGLVNADSGQIDQVVMNLCVNARDAMSKGGTLTIETANVDLDGAAAADPYSVVPGRYVMLAVTDTGCGMNTDTQSHLFEPFFTTKEPGKGTGLGLATVLAIVKGSGGYVFVESEPDRGSTFKIYLPRFDRPDVSTPSDVAATPAPGGRETILLVEDEDALRALVSRVLQRHGYRVLEASTGSEALRTARRLAEPIQLLLTDVVMPGMGGSELAKLMVEMRPEIKVLYMSGYVPDTAFLRDTPEAGAPLLQKPFTPDSLALIVRQTLDGHRDLPA